MQYVLEEDEYNDLQNKIENLQDKNEHLIQLKFQLQDELNALHKMIACINNYTSKDANGEYGYFTLTTNDYENVL